MAAHAAIIRPKFELVEEIFSRELGGLGIASWTKPRGGYFVSLDVPSGIGPQNNCYGEGCGPYTDTRRSDLSERRRPTRPEYSNRTNLWFAGRNSCSHGHSDAVHQNSISRTDLGPRLTLSAIDHIPLILGSYVRSTYKNRIRAIRQRYGIR